MALSETQVLRARYVRAVLAWHNVTGAELAAILQCKQQTASMKLRGERDFKPDELIAIADHFGLEAAHLLRPPSTLPELLGPVRNSEPDLLTSTFHRSRRSEAIDFRCERIFVLTSAA